MSVTVIGLLGAKATNLPEVSNPLTVHHVNFKFPIASPLVPG